MQAGSAVSVDVLVTVFRELQAAVEPAGVSLAGEAGRIGQFQGNITGGDVDIQILEGYQRTDNAAACGGELRFVHIGKIRVDGAGSGIEGDISDGSGYGGKDITGGGLHGNLLRGRHGESY